MGKWLPFISLMASETQPDGSSDTISDIPLDVRESSAISFTATPSENPVESGGTITDHIVKGPPSISLSGLVSDSPITSVPATQAATQGDSAEQIGPGTRSLSAYQALYRAWDKGLALTVITEMGIFEDMVITSLQFPRDRDRGGNAVWFSLELTHVVVVESLSATLPPDVIAKLKRRRSKTAKKLSTRQKELAAKKARETATGKVSTTTPTTSTSTAATSSASTYAGATGR